VGMAWRQSMSRAIPFRAGSLIRIACIAGCLGSVLPASAQGTLAPSSVFVQGGTTGHTQTATVGVARDWDRQWSLGSGRLTGYTEASVAQWWYRSEDPARERTGLIQLALVPVLRWRPTGGESPWFGDVGIGLTLTSRLYKSDRRAFSTAFNFGDHLAIGRNFGAAREHEVALRVEHFSNGSIKDPNPGETFLQLRYSYRFR
jgi:lipid A 3-O-deacylase